MPSFPISNPVLTPEYLQRTFNAVEKVVSGLQTDSANLSTTAGTNSAQIVAIQTGLIRAAVVESDIAASAGFPAIGSGTIKLISLTDPTVTEDAILPAYTYDTAGFVATSVLFVVQLNNSYFVIKS